MCAAERGEILTYLHFQMVLKDNFNSPPMLSKKIKATLGWEHDPLVDHIVSCKNLRDEGLHTFLGIVGYCLEDNG